MPKITFVIGGCRSGKSRHAQELAEATAPANRVYVATCVPYDDEMRDRVRKHQADRDRTWKTVEAPLDLPDTIRDTSRESGVLLVDCLTLWTTNLLLDPERSDRMPLWIDRLAEALEAAQCPVILVSNEVGGGIVPENALARQFRDWVGTLNQRIAACADRVIWTVAGIPVTIKGGGSG